MTEEEREAQRRLGALDARISRLEARRVTDTLWIVTLAVMVGYMVLTENWLDRFRALLGRL